MPQSLLPLPLPSSSRSPSPLPGIDYLARELVTMIANDDKLHGHDAGVAAGAAVAAGVGVPSPPYRSIHRLAIFMLVELCCMSATARICVRKWICISGASGGTCTTSTSSSNAEHGNADADVTMEQATRIDTRNISRVVRGLAPTYQKRIQYHQSKGSSIASARAGTGIIQVHGTRTSAN